MFSTQLISALALSALACAASLDMVSVLEARASAPALPSGWKLTSACAEDDGAQRVFKSSGSLALQRNVLEETNTPKACLTLCGKNGYGYAALRYGTECWCGQSKPVIKSKPKSQCDRPCSGDDTQICGGHTRSAVYTNSALAGKKPTLISSSPKLSSGWSVAYKCINDPELGETLLKSTKVYEMQNNTPQACTALCAKNGYTIAGVEYSNECMCGKGFRTDAHPENLKKPTSECNMACTGGNGRLTCGAGHRVQLYKHASFKGKMVGMDA
ncbi:WSC-domain-containing protein [Exidia glandulosa HHB12029]|uniref:WSC-domain-containing protein n=1 Tax=Exidia glandulosa HHB12029 TaxID=1314781 RepID=A0A165P466_EXIGL|nr:WSC-domain-containing protein [Exidia glandulosa HHB12029]